MRYYDKAEEALMALIDESEKIDDTEFGDEYYYSSRSRSLLKLFDRVVEHESYIASYEVKEKVAPELLAYYTKYQSWHDVEGDIPYYGNLDK